MTHKNDIVELECELISRLNQSRELFVQQLTDSAETDIVDSPLCQDTCRLP